MQSSLTLVKRFVQPSTLSCLVILWLSLQAAAQPHTSAGSTPPATAAASAEHDALLDDAFDHFYNLDYDRSIQELSLIHI